MLPRPETAATVVIAGVAPEDAARLMAAVLGSPHEVSGAAYILAATPHVAPLPAGTASSRCVSRGRRRRSRFSRDALLAELEGAEKLALGDNDTAALWRDIGNAPLAGLADRAIWRVSVAPSRALRSRRASRARSIRSASTGAAGSSGSPLSSPAMPAPRSSAPRLPARVMRRWCAARLACVRPPVFQLQLKCAARRIVAPRQRGLRSAPDSQPRPHGRGVGMAHAHPHPNLPASGGGR